MEIDKRIVIPFLTLIFIFTMNMDLDFDILKYFGVKRYSMIGAMYDMVPHTRPLLVSGGTVGPANEEEYKLVGGRPSDYEGPTTITYLISNKLTFSTSIEVVISCSCIMNNYWHKSRFSIFWQNNLKYPSPHDERNL